MAVWKKIALSLFILFHLGAVIEWNLPDGSPIKTDVYGFYEPYVIGTGIWQSWNMFAPEPSNLNLYIQAKIRHSDGTVGEFTMPRMDKLGYIDRYEHERFRKYVENIRQDSFGLFWPDLARWIARQDQEKTHKTPVHVELIRTWWNVPVTAPADTTEAPVYQWSSWVFFVTDIRDGEPVNSQPVTNADQSRAAGVNLSTLSAAAVPGLLNMGNAVPAIPVGPPNASPISSNATLLQTGPPALLAVPGHRSTAASGRSAGSGKTPPGANPP